MAISRDHTASDPDEPVSPANAYGVSKARGGSACHCISAGTVTGSESMMSATVTPSSLEVTAVCSTAARADCPSR